MFFIKPQYAGRQLPNGFFWKRNTPAGFVEHSPDKAELVSSQQFFVEQIFVKLYGYFMYFFAFAFMGKPCMHQVRAYQHQFHVVNFLHMVAHHTLGTFGITDKVQFIFLVVVKRKIEIAFVPGKKRETIRLR